MAVRRSRIVPEGRAFEVGNGVELPAESERGLVQRVRNHVAFALDAQRRGETLGFHTRAALQRALEILNDMRRQLDAGVHVNPSRRHRANPALVIYGNPGRRAQGGEVCLSKGQVQAIIYTHERDGSDRVHGFGDADIQLSNDGDALVIEGLEAHTGVSMYGLPDKRRIVVRGDDDQKVWDYFPEGE